MLSLLRAELFKLGRRPMGWLMLGASLALVTLGLGFIAVVSRQSATPFGGFPSGLMAGPQLIAQSLGTLFMLALGASLVGSEYGYDTWKNLLTRRPGRLPFIGVKWITLLIAVVIGIIVVAVWSQGLTLAAQALLDIPPAPEPGLGAVLLQIGAVTWFLAIAGSLGLFGATLARSTVGGIVIGFVWITLDSIVEMIPQAPVWLKGVLLAPSLANLNAAISGQPPAYPLWQSLLALAAYLLAPLATAIIIFRRRDMLG